MKIGVFTQWVSAQSVEELASKIRALGLESVVLDSFPGLEIDLDDPSEADCRRIKDAFEASGVKIAAVGGYSNLLHQDPKARENVHRRFRGLMKLCQGIGCPMLCSETGTFHATSDWEWDPSNATEPAFRQLKETVKALAAEAAQYGVTLGLEPYVMNVLYEPVRAARFVEELWLENVNNVKLVMDPAGILTKATLDGHEPLVQEAFRHMNPHLGLIHVEDCRPDPQGHFYWLGAGQGHLNYPVFMDEIIRSGYTGPLILEHMKEADIPAARDYVRRHLHAALVRAERTVRV